MSTVIMQGLVLLSCLHILEDVVVNYLGIAGK